MGLVGMVPAASRTEIASGERASRLALAGLATWRLAHLLALEDGPADAVVKLRELAGSGPLGGLMDCFDCLSIWVAAGFAPFVARRPGERLLRAYPDGGVRLGRSRVERGADARAKAWWCHVEPEDKASRRPSGASRRASLEGYALSWLALSGLACALQRLVAAGEGREIDLVVEEEEKEAAAVVVERDELLRS